MILTLIGPEAEVLQMFQIQPAVFPTNEIVRIDNSLGKLREQVEVIPGISIVLGGHQERTAHRENNCC